MHIVVHDYSGHPFQLQLSRALARRGHDVRHQYCVSYTTGKGAVIKSASDPDAFEVEPLAMKGEFARYSPLRRIVQEVDYGIALQRNLKSRRPDVVVMCNIPLIAHALAALGTRRAGVPMVFWQQDVYSHAINSAARRALGALIGGSAGWVADRIERWIARSSKHVVAISDDFRGVLRRWGLPNAAVTVIPNWAALPEMPERPRDNAWAREHGLVGRDVILYSGTLGLKHDPRVFSVLASALRRHRPDARVVVVSEGQGRDWLERERDDRGLDNLLLLDYQPYDVLPDVLASADVLVTVLEPDASRYSVPSKVLNYLCAGRAVLGIMPADNGAASTLVQSGAGKVARPGDDAAAVDALLGLLEDADERRRMGAAGRRYAEANFDVEKIAEAFDEILSRASGHHALAADSAASLS
ncbi:MAG: glycosyltransferase family 4 protein [Actinomycetota bacterium]|nr:glycosyltransferase family 4 protein [Actinomycetota bacterium]